MPAELKKEKLYAVDEEEDDGIPKEAPSNEPFDMDNFRRFYSNNS